MTEAKRSAAGRNGGKVKRRSRGPVTHHPRAFRCPGEPEVASPAMLINERTLRRLNRTVSLADADRPLQPDEPPSGRSVEGLAEGIATPPAAEGARLSLGSGEPRRLPAADLRTAPAGRAL